MISGEVAPLIPIYRKCEEASAMSIESYIPCGLPAILLVHHTGRKEGPYFMCKECADHNVSNRRAKILAVASA